MSMLPSACTRSTCPAYHCRPFAKSASTRSPSRSVDAADDDELPLLPLLPSLPLLPLLLSLPLRRLPARPPRLLVLLLLLLLL